MILGRNFYFLVFLFPAQTNGSIYSKVVTSSGNFLRGRSALFCGPQFCADLRTCRCAAQKKIIKICADLCEFKNLHKCLRKICEVLRNNYFITVLSFYSFNIIYVIKFWIIFFLVKFYLYIN